MTEDARHTPETGWQPNLPPWSNLVLQPDDEEITWIHQLERQAMPIPPVAAAIRELITRFEICHFKAERHIARIVEAIGTLSLDFKPANIGQAHPKSGESAWQGEKTGRSRQGQEFIWALQMWLDDAHASDKDHRRVPSAFLEEVTRALGPCDARKRLLVSALLNRLLLRAGRQPLPPELGGFWEPVERTDICHYAFPSNLWQMLGSVGKLEPPSDFAGCGSCDDAQRRMAQEHFRALCAWLRAEPGLLENRLGNRSPVKTWLVASLAKTLKEQVCLSETLPSENS